MTRTCISCHTQTDAAPCPNCGSGVFSIQRRPQSPLEEKPTPYDYHVHANEVRECRACYQRVVWVKNTYNKYVLMNVPDTERGKSWIGIDTHSKHDCPRKDY